MYCSRGVSPPFGFGAPFSRTARMLTVHSPAVTSVLYLPFTIGATVVRAVDAFGSNVIVPFSMGILLNRTSPSTGYFAADFPQPATIARKHSPNQSSERFILLLTLTM